MKTIHRIGVSTKAKQSVTPRHMFASHRNLFFFGVGKQWKASHINWQLFRIRKEKKMPRNTLLSVELLARQFQSSRNCIDFSTFILWFESIFKWYFLMSPTQLQGRSERTNEAQGWLHITILLDILLGPRIDSHNWTNDTGPTIRILSLSLHRDTTRKTTKQRRIEELKNWTNDQTEINMNFRILQIQYFLTARRTRRIWLKYVICASLCFCRLSVCRWTVVDCFIG